VQPGRLKALKLLGAARDSHAYCQEMDWRFTRSRGEAVTMDARMAMTEDFMVAREKGRKLSD
jgi:hypothetical protein